MIRKTPKYFTVTRPHIHNLRPKRFCCSEKAEFSWNLLQRFTENTFLGSPQTFKTVGQHFFRMTLLVPMKNYNPLLADYPITSEADNRRLCVSLAFDLRRRLDAADGVRDANAEKIDFTREGYDKIVQAQNFYEIDANQRVLLKGFLLSVQISWFPMHAANIPDRRTAAEDIGRQINQYQATYKKHPKALLFFEDIPRGLMAQFTKRDARSLSNADFFREIFAAFRQEIFQGFQCYEEEATHKGRRFFGYIPALRLFPFLHQLDITSPEIRKNLVHFATLHIYHSFINYCRLVFADHPLSDRFLGPIAISLGNAPATGGDKTLDGFLIAMEFQVEAGPKGSPAAAQQIHRIVDDLLPGISPFVKKYNLSVEA